MKMKTEELTGAALDWAVAKAAGLNVKQTAAFGLMTEDFEDWAPSTDWCQGGPLIEKYIVVLMSRRDQGGTVWEWHMPHQPADPLQAAMRAIVVAEMGDEVDVPEELLEAGE